jgi:ubiquinone/menaquinone biosynthesis C-methylase UbiE
MQAQSLQKAPYNYLLGHSDDELTRLTRQAAFLDDLTDDVFRRAGLETGMRVLDVGCGAGDVSLIAARIVGPRGTVLGIDCAAEPLDLARCRAASEGLHWVSFAQAELSAFETDFRFDAVVGRLVLVYAPDPAATLRALLRHVVPGGIVAFQEMDINRAATVPETPQFRRCLEWVRSLYEGAALIPDSGSRLGATFRAAGLTPSMSGACKIESGAEGFGYAWLAQTVRSLLPAMVQLGVATPEEVGVETLEDRLRQEARDSGACLICPLMVGAWARTPEHLTSPPPGFALVPG